MSGIEWFRRRQIPSPRAVKDFAQVGKDQELPLDFDRDERLAKLLSDDAIAVTDADNPEIVTTLYEAVLNLK